MIKGHSSTEFFKLKKPLLKSILQLYSQKISFTKDQRNSDDMVLLKTFNEIGDNHCIIRTEQLDGKTDSKGIRDATEDGIN